MDKQERIDSRKICDAATNGWTSEDGDTPSDEHGYPVTYDDSANCSDFDKCKPNHVFIVHAREAMPKALDYIEKSEKLIETVSKYNEILAEGVDRYKKALEEIAAGECPFDIFGIIDNALKAENSEKATKEAQKD